MVSISRFPSIAPKAMEEGKEGISQVTVLWCPSAQKRLTRKGSKRSYLLLKQPPYPILSCTSFHMPSRLYGQVGQISWLALLLSIQAAGSLLQHRAHAEVSCIPLLTRFNVCVCCRFLVIKKGALALQAGRWWALGPFGGISAWLE